MDLHKRYTELSIKTGNNLSTIARSLVDDKLTQLPLPEVEGLIDRVAHLVPAGNVPGMILNGLRRLPGRKLPQQTVRRDINRLFKGVEQSLDGAVYSAFFAGPAAIIWGYQSLLKLSGKEPDDAFPEGPWQFYVDYAMREDTARHANETHGFDTLLAHNQIRLSERDRITAWVMAATRCLHQYQALLANEWRERVYTHLLTELTQTRTDAAHYAQLYRAWEKDKPYRCDSDAAAEQSYADYRAQKFDQFLAQATQQLPGDLRESWLERIRRAEAEELPAFQEQMSILAYLDPGSYGETRTPIPFEKSQVGLIHGGNYYLIPVCEASTKAPVEVQTVQAAVAAILAGKATQAVPLTPLAKIKRAAWPELRKKLGQRLLNQLDQLRLAPILLNCDLQPRRLCLAELRQAERGLGDHALSLFDTGESMVFDQSHIFFDGAWGAALAEIMTQEALSWARYLNVADDAPVFQHIKPVRLKFDVQAADLEFIRRAPRVPVEAAAETEAVDLETMLDVRRLFKQRNDLLRLTVNDLLILYRAIHAATYEPAEELTAELNSLTQQAAARPAALAALEALRSSNEINPALVIPVDVSRRAPRDRLHPITFEVPLQDLDIIALHHQAKAALDAYRAATEDRSQAYAQFHQSRRKYLAVLAHFGEVLSRVKEIALAGESASIGALKLLAHLPPALQRILDEVPGRFDLLNDLIKGREAFSNVGAVAPSSSLTRFLSAKDDNDKKTLIWGVITDADRVMRLSLRDFRPHVAALAECGQHDLARRLTQDYLEAYARGLNVYIGELQEITEAGRETQLRRD